MLVVTHVPHYNLSVCFRYYVEFLDECLEAHQDNILQENMFTILTSMEMVALARVMAIVHYKIALPMRWLAGNTHHMHAVGYDWSARSMGKAIDALHDALVEVANDNTKFLDHDFMSNMFSEIHEDENGNKCPLEPLVDAMQYYMGKKTQLCDKLFRLTKKYTITPVFLL